jgi:hypothetical protein
LNFPTSSRSRSLPFLPLLRSFRPPRTSSFSAQIRPCTDSPLMGSHRAPEFRLTYHAPQFSPLPGFALRDVALRAAELLRHLHLRQPRSNVSRPVYSDQANTYIQPLGCLRLFRRGRLFTTPRPPYHLVPLPVSWTRVKTHYAALRTQFRIHSCEGLRSASAIRLFKPQS